MSERQRETDLEAEIISFPSRVIYPIQRKQSPTAVSSEGRTRGQFVKQTAQSTLSGKQPLESRGGEGGFGFSLFPFVFLKFRFLFFSQRKKSNLLSRFFFSFSLSLSEKVGVKLAGHFVWGVVK